MNPNALNVESAPAVAVQRSVRHQVADCTTPEQHLKGIFLHLQKAELLPEPERTEQLKRMIAVALDDLAWVKMPNAPGERPGQEARELKP